MLIFILKKIIYLNDNQDFDGKLWIQKALLVKNFKKNAF